jgi:SAM-dependent methyltransferase
VISIAESMRQILRNGATAPANAVSTGVVQCTICQSSAWRWATKRCEKEEYRIYRCHKCGYGFVHPRPSKEFIAAYYRASGHRVNAGSVSVDSVLHAEANQPNSTIDARRMIGTIRKLMNGRELSNRLLDVGAGYGFFSKEAARAGFDVSAINPAQNEQSICLTVSGVAPLQTTFEAVMVAPGSLSVVLMSQVLEHALDVDEWVRKAWQLLRPGGILAIALPNFGSLQRLVLREREPYVCPPDHLNFFTPKALVQLLHKRGFQVEAIQHVSRVPLCTFHKHVRGMAAPLATPLWLLTRPLFRTVDAVRLGSIINVYASRGA